MEEKSKEDMSDVKFIEDDLVPEMVHARCFCDAGSREYVELESVRAETVMRSNDDWTRNAYLAQQDIALYRARVVVQFSGDPQQFDILIKLLPEGKYDGPGFDSILNEEMLWNKGTPHYGREFFPKIYLADLGKYGRPVIVVEDLSKIGFVRVLDRKLNLEEAKCVADFIGRFHKRGMELKEKQFAVFREFYSKFQEIVLTEDNIQTVLSKMKKDACSRDLTLTEPHLIVLEKSLKDFVSKHLDPEHENHGQLDTICQGRLVRDNLWFGKQEGSEDKLQVRLLDWGQARRGSGSLDLACLLAESELDHRTQLIKTYIDALGLTGTLTEQHLCDDLAEKEVTYAFLAIGERKEWLELLKG